ncbi:MAG: caspase family protein [Chloroflexi bacterium]|nr:caspase family protein [Chloroflexota bacterium]
MSKQFMNGYALLVGVDENYVPRWALPDVAKDVKALEEVLLHPARCAYPEGNVKIITGQDATRQGIMDGLEWLQERVEADTSGNATAVVYYTGHGWRDRVSDPTQFYFIPYDIREGRIKSRALRATDLAEAIGELGPQRLLVVLDCCHAGGMGVKDPLLLPEGYAGAAVPSKLLMEEEGETVGPGAKGIEDLAQGQGRAVLSSSTGDQSSYLRRDGKMSIFTYHLIEALTGHAQPQEGATEVLVSDVMSHVWRHVPQSAKREWSREQTPDYQVSGNFPIALLLGGEGLSKGQPAPDPLEELIEGSGSEQHIQKVVGSSHVAQADRGGTAIVGDSNVVTVIRQEAGDGAIQIGQARDVDVRRGSE